MEFLTEREAAALLRVRPTVLRDRLLTDGVPLVVLSNRRWRIARSHLEAWLEGPAAEPGLAALQRTELKSRLIRRSVRQT